LAEKRKKGCASRPSDWLAKNVTGSQSDRRGLGTQLGIKMKRGGEGEGGTEQLLPNRGEKRCNVKLRPKEREKVFEYSPPLRKKSTGLTR